MEVFAPVYRYPLKTLRELECCLRPCVLEADRVTLKSNADVWSFKATINGDCVFQDTAKDTYKAQFVYRRPRKIEASSMSSIVKLVLAEAHERIGLVERSHAVLCTLYKKNLHWFIPYNLCLSAFHVISGNKWWSLQLHWNLSYYFGFQCIPKNPFEGYLEIMLQHGSNICECTNIVTEMMVGPVRAAVKPRSNSSCLEMENVLSTLTWTWCARALRESRMEKRYKMLRVQDQEVDVLLWSWKISTFENLTACARTMKKRNRQSRMLDIPNDARAVQKRGFSSDGTRIMTRLQTKQMKEMTKLYGKFDNFSDKELYRDSRMLECNRSWNWDVSKLFVNKKQ